MYKEENKSHIGEECKGSQQKISSLIGKIFRTVNGALTTKPPFNLVWSNSIEILCKSEITIRLLKSLNPLNPDYFSFNNL